MQCNVLPKFGTVLQGQVDLCDKSYQVIKFMLLMTKLKILSKENVDDFMALKN